MRKILFILLLPLTLFGQSQKISDMTSATSLTGSEYVPIVQTTNKKSTVSLIRGFGSYGTAGQYLTVNGTTNGITFVTPPFISAYPGAGIAVSTGSAWGTSITDNSTNWNTAYGWGNHAGLYRPISYVPSWSDITSKPTTIAGYGITDFNSLGDARYWLKNGTTTLSSNTYINGGVTVDFGFTGTALSAFNVKVKNASSGISLYYEPASGTSHTAVSLNQNQAVIQSWNGTGSQFKQMIFDKNSSTGIFIKESVGNKGMYYESDYSTSGIATHGSRWIPDWNAVNSVSATHSNKSISLGSNTVTGTTAQFNAALSDNDFATLIGSETLSNKTLGSGTWWSSAPTITDGLTITFNPNGTQAGFNFGSHTSNPSVGNPGDGYYNSTDNDVMLNDGNWRPAVLTDKVQTLTNKTISPTANTIRYPTRTQSGTSYTIQASDENYIIQFTSASAIAVTLPDGLSTNFNCTLMNYGGGVITVTAATTLNTAGGANTIETQYTGASFQHVGSNVWDGVGALGSAGGGSGDVVGPASATDNAVVRYDATTGKLIQNSGFVIDDDNNVTIGTGTAGSARIFYAAGSASDVDITMNPKGAGVFNTGKVQTLWTDAGTNNALETVRHERQSSGTVAAGFGIIHEYRLENASNAVGAAAKWTYTYSDPTNAAEVSTAKLTTKNAGSDVDMINVDGNKLGLFSATPVVKQGAASNTQDIADALTAYGLLPTSTILDNTTRKSALTIEADFYTDTSPYSPSFVGAAISGGTDNVIAGEANHPGIIDLRDGTTANGGWNVSTAANAFLLAGGEKAVITFQIRNARATANGWMGFKDNSTNAQPTDGAYVYFVGNGTTVTMDARTRSNSTETINGTTWVPTLNTWYTLVITVNSSGTQVDYEVFNGAGTSQWAVNNTTNIPTGAGRQTGFGIQVNESTTDAAAAIVYLDYARMEINRVLTR